MFSLKEKYLHNALWIPEDGISVEISSGVEPEVELLFSVSLALAKHICVKNVGITAQISQKLKIYFVPSRSFRRQLQRNTS